MIQLTRSYIKDVYMIHEIKKLNLSHEIIEYILKNYYEVRYNINHYNKFWYYLGKETSNMSGYSEYVNDVLTTAFNKTFVKKYYTTGLFTNIKDKLDDILFLVYNDRNDSEYIDVLGGKVRLTKVFYNNYSCDIFNFNQKLKLIHKKKGINNELRDFVINIFNRIIDYINFIKSVPNIYMTVPWTQNHICNQTHRRIKYKFEQIEGYLIKLQNKYEKILEFISKVPILD